MTRPGIGSGYTTSGDVVTAMSTRRNLYVSGFVAASLSYIFVVLAFTGTFDVRRWTVFAVLFLAVMYGFERFVAWAETLEG